MYKRVADRYLQAAAFPKELTRLDPKTKRLINNAFGKRGLDENGNFETAEKGYSAAWDVLSDFNVVVEDIVSSHIFRDGSTVDGKANDGHTNLRLAFKTNDAFTNISISNSLLMFAFHRKETGKFGCLVYVS